MAPRKAAPWHWQISSLVMERSWKFPFLWENQPRQCCPCRRTWLLLFLAVTSVFALPTFHSRPAGLGRRVGEVCWGWPGLQLTWGGFFLVLCHYAPTAPQPRPLLRSGRDCLQPQPREVWGWSPWPPSRTSLFSASTSHGTIFPHICPQSFNQETYTRTLNTPFASLPLSRGFFCA